MLFQNVLINFILTILWLLGFGSLYLAIILAIKGVILAKIVLALIVLFLVVYFFTWLGHETRY